MDCLVQPVYSREEILVVIMMGQVCPDLSKMSEFGLNGQIKKGGSATKGRGAEICYAAIFFITWFEDFPAVA